MRLCLCWKHVFFQDSCQSFYGPGQFTLCQCYLKMHVVGEGPGASVWVLRHFLSSVSSLLVALWHPTPVILPGKSHGQRSLVGCSPWGREESDTTERLLFHFSLSRIGEGNCNSVQCSCLENPRDVGAWWAAVYGVAQNSTRLKQLSSSSISYVTSG